MATPFSTITIGTQGTLYLIDTREPPNKIITLPTASTSIGRILVFKDYFGNANNSTFTLSTIGLDFIDDKSKRYSFSNAFGSINVIGDGGTSWRTLGLYNGAFTQ